MFKYRMLVIAAQLAFVISALWLSELSAAEKPSWQADWDATLQAAKKEGQIMIYAAIGPYHPSIFAQFQVAFPEIKVTLAHGNSSRISPRLLAERRAGKYLADVYLGGPTSLYSFYKNQLFDPLAPQLILPEILDTSLWWEGKHFYIDAERKFIFVNEGSVSGFAISYNTQLVKAAEFKSYWDLLNPKWRGKIVSLDARDPGFGASELRYVYYHPELGPEYLRRFFGEMDVHLSRDHQQSLDWVGVGKFALCAFCRDGFVTKAKKQGVPVDYVVPNELKEMPRLRGSASAITLVNRAPNPNAAKVFINWLLSRSGQIAVQKRTMSAESPADSLRIDIPKEEVPYDNRRLEGIRYLDTGKPEWIEMKPVLDVVNEALKSAGKN